MKKRIYLYENGTLKRQDNSIVFIDKKGNKFYIPIFQIDNICIFGHCEFNKDLINLLFEYNISIMLYSFHGRYLGSYKPNCNKLGSLLIKQVHCIEDENIKKEYSEEIIVSSIKNMLAVLKYYNKKYKILIKEINDIENELNNYYTNSKNLLMYEARIKQIYYESFNYIIRNPNFKFNNRTVHPPEDEINALLSYGYALLYGILENDIYNSNLEISLPFIHGITRKATGL